VLATGLLLLVTTLVQTVHATGEDQTEFKSIPTQFIAALGDPDATSGNGAQSWGLWRLDPGPAVEKVYKYLNARDQGNNIQTCETVQNRGQIEPPSIFDLSILNSSSLD